MKMFECGYYGVVSVSSEIFDRLNSDFFISQSDEKTKYMCANPNEQHHLQELGIDLSDVVCDWFKITLK
jgi:hypothetical protein